MDAYRSRLTSKVLLACALGGSLFSCYPENEFDIAKVPESVIEVQPETEDERRIPADGLSSLEIIAKISVDADDDKRDVMFTTTAGKFENGEKSITKKADAQGNATVSLTSGLLIETAGVTISIQKITREIQVEFQQVDFTLASGETTISGNGVSSTKLTVTIPEIGDGFKRTVTLAASKGRFSNQESTITLEFLKSDAGVKEVDYISSAEEASSTVTGKYFDVTKTHTIIQEREFPVGLSLTAERSFIYDSAGVQLSLFATLIANEGTPSSGHPVTFIEPTQDVDGNTIDVKIENQSRSNLSGVATATLTVFSPINPGSIILGVTSTGENAVQLDTAYFTLRVISGN